MENYFCSNLKKLSQKYSQKQIAEDTLMSPASITNYVNQTSEPSMFFLMQLKKVYNVSIDDFLFKDLNFDDMKSDKPSNTDRFVGNYIVYYYETSPYKGSSNIFTKNALNYGVISMFNDNVSSLNKLTAYAQFLLNRKEAEELVKTLNENKNTKQVKRYYENLTDKYEGTINLSSSHIFLSLKNAEKDDECFMILNNPPSHKTYIGGIATVNSIARGREHMPCVQYAIISQHILNITDGEIYSLLALNVPEMNVDLEVDHFIKLFKSLYINTSNTSLNLNEYQKKRIIEESFKKILEELIDNNLFRFAKISDMEDDKYYRIIKEEMLNE